MKLGERRIQTGLILLAMVFAVAAEAAPLTTSQNSSLSVPAANIASALPAPVNLVGSNFLLAAVSPTTLYGGRASLANSQPWVRRYNGGPGSSQNAPLALVVRGDGSVVITGYSLRPGSDYDFATISYAPDGTALWTNRYDGPGHGSDTARLLAVNPGGDVWVVGDSARIATNSTLTDVAVIKYASNGLPVWTNRYSSFDTNAAYPVALAVDGSGNAYVGQSAAYWQSWASGWPVADAIIKYDASGNVVWTKHYPVAAPDSGQDLHELGPLALDDAGNLFVAGMSGSEHYDTGTSIVKFAPDGTSLWTNHHGFQFMSLPRLLSIDRQGNPILTGESSSNGIVSYMVMKCSKDGPSLWTNVMAGPGYDGGNVPQTLIDTAGSILLIGGSPGSSPGLYQILKLSSNGIPLWTNLTANFGATNGMISGSSVDSAGNLYLAGLAGASGNGRLDYVTVKYSGNNGQPLWTNRFNGAANLDDIPFALAVDGAGNVYVTGESQSSPGNWDFATVKYADLLIYAPPRNFTGSDTITYVLTDNFGNSATSSVEVVVAPGSFQFNLSPVVTRWTPGGMQLQVDGAPGTHTVVLEASTDLMLWQPILTNSPNNGSVQFLDPAAIGIPQRFYRVLQQQ